MARVMAQGTFDILHPGHLHYFRESADLGSELSVVIARDSRMQEHKDLYMDEESRRKIVAALEMVDNAILGSEGDIFDTVDEIAPDIITLGHDQQFQPEKLERELAEAGFEGIRLVRITAYDGPGITSSSDIKQKVKKREGEGVFESIRSGDE
ncbi:FAD synthase [Natrinema caseinilyticum]|uniref:FAD synthase n=1 Tax=Natrinema caseinilyticum TaxID=2961570 RepID=UPI0020C355B9|nr:FAD synthase [Natrinema caseinilyticum]